MIMQCKRCPMKDQCICNPTSDECSVRIQSYNKALDNYVMKLCQEGQQNLLDFSDLLNLSEDLKLKFSGGNDYE